MIHSIIPPREPAHPEPVNPRMIYVKQALRWEYKQIQRNLESEAPLDEAELNVLGREGWELTSVLHHGGVATFYFKRLAEK